MPSGHTAVSVDGLRKTYATTVAVDDISFMVHTGEIFGMVGPNGAGKTTAVECIEGLRRPTSGRIAVLGMDPQREGYQLRARIGIQLQESELQARIKVWEAMDLFANLYPRHVDWRQLLEELGLADRLNAHFMELSGGQKQRLFIALALVNDPEIVFLDELTTGLDPQARHATWEMVRSIRKAGKTVFLITHSMEEAERLCDRVSIVDHGRIVAMGSPSKLIEQHGAASRIILTVEGQVSLSPLQAIAGVEDATLDGDRLVVLGGGDSLLPDILTAVSEQGRRYRDVRTEQSSLEDVFLKLTGKAMRE